MNNIIIPRKRLGNKRNQRLSHASQNATWAWWKLGRGEPRQEDGALYVPGPCLLYRSARGKLVVETAETLVTASPDEV